MSNAGRINDDELIAREHFPVKALFNMVPDYRFKTVIKSLSENTGFGENYGACVFWNDLDDYDKENIPFYAGAEFGLHDGTEVIIGHREILHYIKLICKKYCIEHPDDSDEIAEYIRQFIERNSLLND